MRIELYHASKFGNGAKVAEELRRIAEAKGHHMKVHHIDSVRSKEVPPADLYVFGSPTRFGRPIGSMRRFVRKASLPAGARYAVFATHADIVPDKKTGKTPTEQELDNRRKTIPELDELLIGRGLLKVADRVFDVSADTMKGPLREGWQRKAEEFANAFLDRQ